MFNISYFYSVFILGKSIFYSYFCELKSVIFFSIYVSINDCNNDVNQMTLNRAHTSANFTDVAKLLPLNKCWVTMSPP